MSSETKAALEKLFELGIRLTQGMDVGLDRFGLTRTRAEVIWRLSASGPVTQRALSDMLRVTPRNVTALIDALETGGFVVRRPHPSDRRATLVNLSPSGKRVARMMASGYEQLASRLFGGLSEQELLHVTRLLDHLIVGLRGAEDAPAPADDAPRVKAAGAQGGRSGV